MSMQKVLYVAKAVLAGISGAAAGMTQADPPHAALYAGAAAVGSAIVMALSSVGAMISSSAPAGATAGKP